MRKKIIPYSVILLLSIALWIVVTMAREYYYTLDVPLKFTNLKSNYDVSKITKYTVSIKVKGEGWKLLSLMLRGRNEFAVSASADSGKFSRYLLDYLSDNSWLTSRVQVLDIMPRQVDVMVEKVITKKVKIRPVLNVSYEQGYAQVGECLVFPDSVSLTGPKTLLNRINSITTVVSGDAVKSDFEAITDLDIPFYTKAAMSKVKIKMPVQQIADLEVQDLRVSVYNLPKNFAITVSPEKVKIRIRGGVKEVSKVLSDKINVKVDFSQVLNDTSKYLVPDVEVPKYIQVIEVIPDKVSYSLKKY